MLLPFFLDSANPLARAELYHAATGCEEPGLASEVMRYAAGPAMAELRAGIS